MKQPRWLAAALAPLAAPIAYVLFALIFLPDTTPEHERTWESVLLALAIGFTPSSYIASFAFGAPLVYILGRMNKLTFWRLVVFSAPAGGFASISLLGVALYFGAARVWGSMDWRSAVTCFAVGAVLGMVNGAAFGWLAGLMTPSPDSAHRAKLQTSNALDGVNAHNEE